MAAEWKWTQKREIAAKMLAEDRQTDEAVAEVAGVVRETIVAWKRVPEFAARVNEHVEAYKDACMTMGIADKRHRVGIYADTLERLQTVIEERAAAYADVPTGGKTGLLVKTVKAIGKGDTFQVVEEYAVDTGMLAEMRATMKQAAQELGQWVERAPVDDAGKTVRSGLDGMTLDELLEIRAAVHARRP